MNTQRPKNADGITIHKQADFAGMRKAGELAAKVLDMIGEYVVPGVTTEALDQRCHDFMIAHNSRPATLGYQGNGTTPYTKSSCISVNHVVCHGIPSDKVLSEGDILNIDITCVLDGWYGDNSRMYVAGKPSVKARRLIEVTHDALMKGIEAARSGNHFGDIGHAIQSYVESKQMSVVRDFCGHGLGLVFHAPPHVVHYGKPGSGERIEEGMFFTIEPMVNLGRPETKVLRDGWTAVTRDRSLSAQFEHSIGINSRGAEIFTLSPAGLFASALGR